MNEGFLKCNWLHFSINMADTIKVLNSGLRVGYVGLGYRGEVTGSVRQEVHDGDTIKAKPIGNLSIVFLE